MPDWYQQLSEVQAFYPWRTVYSFLLEHDRAQHPLQTSELALTQSTTRDSVSPLMLRLADCLSEQHIWAGSLAETFRMAFSEFPIHRQLSTQVLESKPGLLCGMAIILVMQKHAEVVAL